MLRQVLFDERLHNAAMPIYVNYGTAYPVVFPAFIDLKMAITLCVHWLIRAYYDFIIIIIICFVFQEFLWLIVEI